MNLATIRGFNLSPIYRRLYFPSLGLIVQSFLAFNLKKKKKGRKGEGTLRPSMETVSRAGVAPPPPREAYIQWRATATTMQSRPKSPNSSLSPFPSFFPLSLSLSLSLYNPTPVARSLYPLWEDLEYTPFAHMAFLFIPKHSVSTLK